MRCFVAVDLADEARAAIAAVQAALRAAGPRADVRWVDPAALHLTLKFLGATDDAQLPQVRDAIATVASSHAPFRIGLAGVGAFPSLARPRTLWAGVARGLREIGLLAADVERAVLPLGFPLEARPFGGHVTLGRVRSPRGLGPVRDEATGFGQRGLGDWTVAEVVLYRSHLSSSGSVYEPLARLALGGAPVGEDG